MARQRYERASTLATQAFRVQVVGAALAALTSTIFSGAEVRARTLAISSETSLVGAGAGAPAASQGSDIASTVTVDFASAIRGSEWKLRLQDGDEEVAVRIPPGAGDGDKVRVRGKGAGGMMGGPRGDLVLTIKVKAHPYFERKGLDLHLDLPITIGEAYKGARVRVPTPDGSVTMTVPKCSQSGQVARLKARGVRRGNQTGNLYVRFMVHLPESESTAVKRAVETLDKAMSEKDVRGDIQL